MSEGPFEVTFDRFELCEHDQGTTPAHRHRQSDPLMTDRTLPQSPRLGRVALVRLDAGQLVERGGLASQVAEALDRWPGIAGGAAALGGVALGRLDDGRAAWSEPAWPRRSPRPCMDAQGALEEPPRSAGLPWADSMMANTCSEAAWPCRSPRPSKMARDRWRSRRASAGLPCADSMMAST